MGWTKDRPTKPGKYAAIHLHETYGGFGEARLISITEDLVPPPSKEAKEGFDWERHDAPYEEWVKVLIAWETGGQGPESLHWYTWFLELEIEPAPDEVQKALEDREAKRWAEKAKKARESAKENDA